MGLPIPVPMYPWANSAKKGSSKPAPGMSWGDFQETQETIANNMLPGSAGLNVQGIQRHLRKQGYKIKVDGKMGPSTKSALADYLKLGKGSKMSPAMAKALKGTVITGKRNPKAWNQRFGNAGKAPNKPLTGPGGMVDSRGNAKPPGPYASKPDGIIDVSNPGPRASFTPYAGPTQGAQLLDPVTFMGGLDAGYDPVIDSLRKQMAARERAAIANATETRDWYGQVVGSLGKAGQRDKAINQAAQASMEDATAAIVSSLGGSANQGAPMVAAEGQSALGTLAALGSAQEQYNADMAPLIEGEGAGMATRVRSAGARDAQELAYRIAEAQSERARARSGMQLDLAQINNEIRQGRADRAMSIRQYNDQLKQQGFQNQLAMGEAQLAAIMADAQLRGLGSKSAPATSYPYAKAPQHVKAGAYNQATAAIQDMPYPQALQTVNRILRGYGWSLNNAAVVALRNQILADAGIKVDPRTK